MQSIRCMSVFHRNSYKIIVTHRCDVGLLLHAWLNRGLEAARASPNSKFDQCMIYPKVKDRTQLICDSNCSESRLRWIGSW